MESTVPYDRSGHLEERAAEVHGVDELSAEVAVDRGPLADSPAGLLEKRVAGLLGLRRPQAEVEVEPPFALGDSGVLSTPERLRRRRPSRMASVDPLKIWKQQVLDWSDHYTMLVAARSCKL